MNSILLVSVLSMWSLCAESIVMECWLELSMLMAIHAAAPAFSGRDINMIRILMRTLLSMDSILETVFQR